MIPQHHQSPSSSYVAISRVVLRLLIFLSLTLNAARAHAVDLCDPNRPFCGRITIIIVGAGESGSFSGRGSIRDVDSDLTDPASGYAYASFHMFRRHEGTPAYLIVITSDPKLTAKLEHLPAKLKVDAGFLGTLPASLDAVQDLLSDDANVSLLQKAISDFSNNPQCRSVMKARGLDSVLSLLKTEIVIEGQNSDGGPPLWSNKSEAGTQADWAKKFDSPSLDKYLIKKLRAKLGDGVVQTFIEACNGAQIGENFQTPDQCSCYLSVADSNTLFRAGGSQPGVFVGVLPDKGRSVRALKANSPGMRNITDFGALLFSHFEKYNTGGDGSGLRPIFADTDRINPLQSFAYNSVDYKAETILGRLRDAGIDSARCNALLNAGFGEQLPQSIAVDKNSVKPDSQLDRILQITSRMRESYAPYVNNIGPKVGAATFVADMKRFRACANHKEAIRECAEIEKIMKVADNGTAIGGGQTDRDQDFIRATNAIMKDFDHIDAPMLIAKYQEGELTISDLFTKLSSLWKEFEAFQKGINSYADHYYKGQVPEELRSALNEMTKLFQRAMMIAQERFFPLLRKGALEVRLARIEEAAKMLALHRSETTNFDPDEELRQLGNDLVCLTAYPVGPAFDAKYGKN